MEKDYIVTKSNKLITCNYDLSVLEQKIILTLASMVQPQDTEFKEYEFKIKDFIKLLGLKDQSKYTELPKITRELKKKVFDIREGTDIIQVSWLGGVRYKTKEGILVLQLEKNLKPYMLELNSLYTSYKLENILNLKSKYSIRLYEILKSNLFKGKITIELEELKSMTGATEKAYGTYTNFKCKVLIQAQKELTKKTDISFEFEEIKTGRKVTVIGFHIKANKPKLVKESTVMIATADDEVSATIDSQCNDLIKQVQAICHEHKITEHEASCILGDADNNIDLIKQCYEYLLTKDYVNNIVGYMRKLVINFEKPQSNAKIGYFNNFEQRTYDFEELEKKLLGSVNN